jgi:hypothetical protein
MMGMGSRQPAHQRGKHISGTCYEYDGKARIESGPPRKSVTMESDVLAIGGTIYLKRGTPLPADLPPWPTAFADAFGTPVGAGVTIRYLDRTAEPVWYVYRADDDGRWQPVEDHPTRAAAEKSALTIARDDR